jgi:hypothetical protein
MAGTWGLKEVTRSFSSLDITTSNKRPKLSPFGMKSLTVMLHGEQAIENGSNAISISKDIELFSLIELKYASKCSRRLDTLLFSSEVFRL